VPRQPNPHGPDWLAERGCGRPPAGPSTADSGGRRPAAGDG
jgi:hypothetical protein